MDCAHPNVSSLLLSVNHSSVAPESQPLRRGHTRVLCIMPSRLHEIYKKIRTEDSSLELDPPKETLGLRYMRRNWVWGQTVTGCIGNIRSLWYYHAGGFLDLLMTGRDFNATDPRDKIYSVLGLARVSTQAATKGSSSSNDNSGAIVIDYLKPVSEVYQHVTKYFINRDCNPDILCILNTHRNALSADLPSWVPDWRITGRVC